MTAHPEVAAYPETVLPIPGRLEELLDPYTILAEARNLAPVVRATVAHGLDVWLVTRHADICRVINHPDVSADPRQAIDVFDRALRLPRSQKRQLQEHRAFGSVMSASDPPAHTRLRKVVAGAFSRQRVDALIPQMAEIARNLIATIRPAGRADLVDDFAVPMSLHIICALLGVPYRDRELIRSCTLGFAQWPHDAAAAADLSRSRARLRERLAGLLAAKADGEDTDVFSDLVRASRRDGIVSDAEVLATAEVLLVNGHDPAAALMSNGMLELLRRPDQLDALRADPGLIPAAVEELVRFTGPTVYVFRYTKTAVEIAGTTIPAGEIICLSLPAGNRDERAFADAGQLRIDRQDNQHVGFGHGIHYCLGAPLARAEARVAFAAILDGLPGLRLAVPPEALSWRRQIRFVKSLPVEFRPGGAAHAPRG